MVLWVSTLHLLAIVIASMRSHFEPQKLSFMPHPLPLAVGQWLHVSVERLEYPLEEGQEREPDIMTPDGGGGGGQALSCSLWQDC